MTCMAVHVTESHVQYIGSRYGTCPGYMGLEDQLLLGASTTGARGHMKIAFEGNILYWRLLCHWTTNRAQCEILVSAEYISCISFCLQAAELRPFSVARMRRVATVAISLCTAVYLGVSLGTAALFGQATQTCCTMTR
jgi:hypothetical protein